MHAGQSITEWEAAEELTHYREEGANYWGLAYENISASGPNAGEYQTPVSSSDWFGLTPYSSSVALPHYSAAEDTAAVIDAHTPYLKYANQLLISSLPATFTN